MLSLFLIEELEREAQESGKTVLFYICNHQDEKRNSAVALMRSFIYQILTKHPALFSNVSRSFEGDRKVDLVLASPQTVWDIFMVLLRACESDICCVLDGLDECDDESIRFLTRNLVDCFSSETFEPAKFRIIIVSRTLTGLKTFQEVKLGPDNNEHTDSDIQRFVSQKVQELGLAISGFNEIKEQVHKVLLERAEGTFLWVGFVADELLRKTTCTQILDALNEMPKGLPSIYSRILSKKEKERRPVLSRLLRWVTVAFRPLSVEELAVGMGIDDTEQLPRQQILIDYISMCGSILQINNDKIGFVHQSAIDYLLEKDLANHTVLKDFYINEESAHSEITGVCIDYLEGSVLHHKPLSKNEALERSKIHPMFEYTLRNWFKHARDGSSILNSDLILDRPFFQKRSYTRDNWLSTFNRIETRYSIRWYTRLHIACCLGIESWVEKELRNGIKGWVLRRRRDSSGKYGIFLFNEKNQLLLSTVENGQQGILKLLLEKGITMKNRTYMIVMAGIMNNEAILRLLLDKCALSEKEMIGLAELAESPAGTYVEKHTIARLLDREARISLAGKPICSTSFHKRSSNLPSNLAWKLWVAINCMGVFLLFWMVYYLI